MVKRKSFAKIQDKVEPQNLVQIQTESYNNFLKKDKLGKQDNYSLEGIFKETFPIESIDGSCRLEYVDYSLLPSKYDQDESRRCGVSYAAPLRVKLRLVTPDDVREQEVYMGALPLMTEIGTFVINGADRVIVSQLHRSPGVCFESNTQPKGKTLYSARVIPHRGAWLEFSFDINDILNITIDRKKKMLATTLLRIFGCPNDEDIINAFYQRKRITKTDEDHLKEIKGKFLASDIVNKKTNEVIAQKWEKLTQEFMDAIVKKDVGTIEILDTDTGEIIKTLKKDKAHSKDEALIDIYKKLRPGDPPTKEAAKSLINRLFFDAKRYDLGKVGRYILNRKLGMKVSLNEKLLTLETLIETIKYLINLKNGEGQIDDIDHLGNRRIRTVAELLQNQFRVGLARMERSARERMNVYDKETMMPHHLINSKLISSVIKDFFGRGQLSQFMDQTNPLAELTHKRRLSALGPGGLSRERAGFEVRDIHYSHYGRVCPIETPEGPNIGLICSLSCYARVNSFGFLETPYRKVENKKVINKIEFLSADIEDNYVIAQANAKLDKDGKFTEKKVFCRYKDDFIETSPKDIEYIDVSPRQLVSVAASLIPFLEHDDANRALMGSNMQRQAVPLLETEIPLVGTGMEKRVAKDSGAVVIAENDGIVKHVQSDHVIVGNEVYNLKKFTRSNASTCINQRPIVRIGQKVKKGDVIADGAATRYGELALGRNVLVGFMPWYGYNFEDAILISEKLVKEDIYTSIHIEEFEIEARDTRLGPEEISCDIPNVGEDALKNLDEEGIVRIGAEVGPNDILVGKITPKSETELSPEEKLLRAIFGEKAGDVKDASLRVPPGVEGIVVDIQEFSRRGAKSKTKEEKKLEKEQADEIRKNYEKQIEKFNKERLKKLAKLLVSQRLISDLVERRTKKILIRKNRKISKRSMEFLEDASVSLAGIKVKDNKEIEEEVKKLEKTFNDRKDELKYERDREIDNVKKGDELPPGVIKRIKVYVASKRKLSVGDKMAGRHGNKGVIAKILPEEDMPFLSDGTPLEIVLNPLGVPSRMNVGQILETHLGWAAKVLGFYAESPIFNGASEKEIINQLKKAGFSEDGKTTVYNGRTGEAFDQRVTVGYIYMMKLSHLVDDKIHARSIGPYSLVTQQPLGGKAQFGGQRFGEMEVWALEAYGAAYTLQELLTVKSDDVLGRTKIYESIVKGENTLQPGIPESFNVLIKELQSLALDVRTERKKQVMSLERISLADERNIFDAISIKIASPEIIKSWSHGEVKKPETINYRTLKPEKDGLFCERIFGPTKDYECNCGKYKRAKHKGIVCDRCGVEVTHSRVRRQRMAHINLVSPCTHVWFFKVMPSPMSAILQMNVRQLERIIYYEEYVVIDPIETPFKKGQFLSEVEYQEAREKYGDKFIVKMGAEAIKDLLVDTDLNKLTQKLKRDIKKTKSAATKEKLAKVLKVIESFKSSGNRPEWMVLSVIPVIPPDLRPLVPLDGGRFATSDLNDLYRRVINRNNRLKKLLELKAPEVIIRNEKRMLQEAVDALFDNGRHGRAILGAGSRPLKSLSDMLKGKQGRFRQNLLGKRVDYSGRSVIVVGPELRLHQCGLPKKMALELFEPFIIKKLREEGHVHTIKSAKRMVEQAGAEVWDILDEVIKEHPVLLNRAPTLHRLGIQAFEPVLIEGKAIRIHPLVCTSFNADFDGDQMAVHIPLSMEAQVESKILMLSSNNIFSPADGRPVIAPTQDIVLGCYYLTAEKNKAKGEGKIFSDAEEVITAYQDKEIELQAKIKVRLKDNKIVDTTCGRVIFNQLFPDGFKFVNAVMNKSKLSQIISECYSLKGHNETIKLLDRLKDIGFKYATLAGLSISMSDLSIPKQKKDIIEKVREDIGRVEKQYKQGIITNGERYNKIIDIWTHATESISNYVFEELDAFNPIFMMADSGARGSKQQIRQLAGMRGLMAKPSGEIIESAITANFREGLTVLEYFISTHGARKGLADTALKTADSGYLTRRLVDVAQDVIVTEEDCGTLNGITVSAIIQRDEVVVSLKDRITGRVALDNIVDIITDKIIVKRNEEITEKQAEQVEKSGIESIKIRSILTCEVKYGVCAKCYGRNLATQRSIELGEAVGVIAAQSIGEPGTQLTMRTFHIGGTASAIVEQSYHRAKNKGIVKYHNLRTVKTKKDKYLRVLNRNGQISINDKRGRESERYTVPQGSQLLVDDGKEVKRGQIFVQWDPYNIPILTEVSGKVTFEDLIEDITVKQEINNATGLLERVVVEHKSDYHPQIVILDEKREILGFYPIPGRAHIEVEDRQKVEAGGLLAKIPRKVTKTKDITGGLPRVAELFEARCPKDPAVISEIDGVVELEESKRGLRKVQVKSETGMVKEYTIPHGKRLNVYKGDKVYSGQQITDGPIVPQDILRIRGDKELQEYLLNEVQEVYRLQGVRINDKHIEVIIRQMLKKVKIEDPGDTNFLIGEQVEKIRFKEENERVIAEGKKGAKASPVLLGITKASLNTESFISAASFQETTRVLTNAAAAGRRDELRGLKENIIMGHLVPAGTGFKDHRKIDVDLKKKAKKKKDKK